MHKNPETELSALTFIIVKENEMIKTVILENFAIAEL